MLEREVVVSVNTVCLCCLYLKTWHRKTDNPCNDSHADDDKEDYSDWDSSDWDSSDWDVSGKDPDDKVSWSSTWALDQVL